MKQASLEFCENCVYGKQKRVRFIRVGKQKKSEKLELVYTYVWGPSQVQSLGGSHYYVTFINDAAKKFGFIALDKNLMCFFTFKTWKSLVENETRKRLKCLGSNNGGEYCIKDFDS